MVADIDATDAAESESTRPVDEPDDLGDPPTHGADPAGDAAADVGPSTPGSRWKHRMVFVVLPVVALLLGATAGFLKWQDSTARDSARAGIESAQAARDATVALLSYQPDTVDKDLTAARSLLTGDFKDSYTSLTNQVVIPGAKQQHIGAVANVRAVAPVSATENRAVDLVFVNQSIIVGTGAPSDTASSVRVTLQKVGDRWLVSGFDPV